MQFFSSDKCLQEIFFQNHPPHPSISFLFPPCRQSATEGLLAGQLTRKKVLAFYKSQKREVVPLTSLRIVETRLLSEITFTSGVYLLMSSYLLLHSNIYNKLFS